MKKSILLGMSAALLMFGLVLFSCDDGGGGGGGVDPIVAKWFYSQSDANTDTGTPMYEFNADGTFSLNGSSLGTSYTYTASNGKLSMIAGGNTLYTADYIISGTKLTISNAGTSLWRNGDFYKK